jgi:SAM-dependent methyltransferase
MRERTRPKPAHLGPAYGAQFADRSVAAAYVHRPPYPTGVFDLLEELLGDEPRVVLDLGCGSGDLARPLAARVERVDAVDPSAAMLAAGRVRWIQATAEEVPLRAPYGLVTAAESLHWMEWSVVLPRVAEALAPGAVLAIVERGNEPLPWDDELLALIREHSTNREFAPYDLIEELESRGLFARAGMRRVGPVDFAQPVDAYVESFHSRNGFSRERLTPEAARAFDEGVARLVARHCPDGIVRLHVFAMATWGRPMPPEAATGAGSPES